MNSLWRSRPGATSTGQNVNQVLEQPVACGHATEEEIAAHLAALESGVLDVGMPPLVSTWGRRAARPSADPPDERAGAAVRARLGDSSSRVDPGGVMAAAGAPVVFLHGLWLHADSWAPWVDLFREAGYAPVAPGWPGDSDRVEETRSRPERVAGYGIGDVVDHYARIIGELDAKPILIGHSFGGVVVQRLLGQDLAAAGVAIDAAPIKGVVFLPPSALRVASVALRNPANKKRAVALTAKQFRYGFGNTLSEAESNELYARWTIPSPGKPLFEAASANFARHSPAAVSTGNATRGPLLLTAGGKDHTVPRAITKATLKLYRNSPAVTDYREFPDRGHTLALDSGWRDVADAVLAWLGERSL